MVNEIEEGTNEEAKKEMTDILKELRKKMSEIDEMTKELQKNREKENKNSPKKTRKILEEITVPSLELLK